MISSHWGMFCCPLPPLMVVPAGFKFSETDIMEWSRTSGYIVAIDHSQIEEMRPRDGVWEMPR